MANDKIIALTATSERPASTASGYVMLIVLLLAIARRRLRRSARCPKVPAARSTS